LFKDPEILYQDLFTNVHDPIFALDLNGDIFDVNKAALTLTGLKRDKLVGINISNLVISKSLKQIIKNRRTLLRGKSNASHECELIGQNKTRKNIKILTSLITSNGQPTAILAFVTDITEQKRKEKILEGLGEKYGILFDNKQEGIVIIDKKIKLLLANTATAEIFGFDSVEELLKINKIDVLNQIAPEERVRVINIVTRDLFQHNLQKSNEIRCLKKNGEEIWVSAKGSKIDYQGKIFGLVTFRDVTKYKRAEETMKKSEEKLRIMFETITDGIAVVDLNGIIIEANESKLRMHGFKSKNDILGKSIFELIASHDHRKQRDNMKKTIEKGAVKNIEYTLLRADGSEFDGELSASLMKDVSGNPTGFIAITRDITEHKKTEEKLRQSEESYRNLFELSPVGVTVVNMDGVITDCNSAVYTKSGYSRDDFIGKHFSKVVTIQAEDMPKYFKLFASLLAGKLPKQFETTYVCKDGTTGWTEVHIDFLKSGGKNVGIQVIQHDITERKMAEKELRQTMEFNSSLLANSPNPILVLNTDTSIKYVNPALEKLTGYSSTELIGIKPPFPWWLESDYGKYTKTLQKNMQQQELTKRERCSKSKNGDFFWVELISTLVPGENGAKYYISNWSDITERKRLKENLAFYISQITRAQEEERKSIAREIHDGAIQSLATISLELGVLTDEERHSLSSDIRQHLEQIHINTINVLKELRFFSHQLRPGIIDQTGLVPALENLTEEQNRDGLILVNLKVSGIEQRLLNETELMLFRIAQEAFRNIRRHSGATKAEVRLRFTHKKVRFTISDNGKGFELNKNLGGVAVEGKLGLIGMQERARLLGSTFSVDSKIGKGTVIAIEVPINN